MPLLSDLERALQASGIQGATVALVFDTHQYILMLPDGLTPDIETVLNGLGFIIRGKSKTRKNAAQPVPVELTLSHIGRDGDFFRV